MVAPMTRLPWTTLATEPLDVIRLQGVSAWGYHGVLEHEKQIGQTFIVDAALHLSTRAAARDDALGRTVNYASVAEIIVDHITNTRWELIETLADRIAQQVLDTFIDIRRLDLTIHKPSAPIPLAFDNVALEITRYAPPVEAVLAVGTNMGERESYLAHALKQLADHPEIEVIAAAPVIETDPVGGVEQQAFLNSVIRVRTSLGPWSLLELCHRLEQAADRQRLVRWGPRTLDVDIITYGDLVRGDADLTLPHPRAHERAFVLSPWLAIDPDATVPDGQKVAELVTRAEDVGGIRPGPTVTGFDGIRP